MRGIGGWGLLLALALALPACRSEERREAERILAAIEALRTAEHERRGPLLEQLERDRADAPAAEQARLACAGAFRSMHDAQVKIREVEAAMEAHREAGTTPEASLLGTLETAQKGLDEAGQAMPECSRQVAALKLSLGR